MDKEIRSRIISIICVSTFLIVMTTFVYLPKQQNFLSSYAFLQNQQSFYMEELTSGILLKDAYPTKDENGLQNDPYTFKVVNTSNKDITYQIKFENNEEQAKEKGLEVLPNKYLRYSLNESTANNLEAKTLSDDGILLTTPIKAKSTTVFDYRMSLDYNSDEGAMNKIFIGTVRIEKVK